MTTKTAIQQMHVAVGLTKHMSLSDALKVPNIATIFQLFDNPNAKTLARIKKEMRNRIIWITVPNDTKTVEGNPLVEGRNTLVLGGKNKTVRFSKNAILQINGGRAVVGIAYDLNVLWVGEGPNYLYSDSARVAARVAVVVSEGQRQDMINNMLNIMRSELGELRRIQEKKMQLAFTLEKEVDKLRRESTTLTRRIEKIEGMAIIAELLRN